MALWTPADTTTALWLDAADSATLFSVTSGSTPSGADSVVGRWEDKSGNARHITQAANGLRPLRKIAVQNGLDVVRFDGVDDRMLSSVVNLGSAGYSCFWVTNSGGLNAAGRATFTIRRNAADVNGYFHHITRNNVTNNSRVWVSRDDSIVNLATIASSISYPIGSLVVNSFVEGATDQWWINGSSAGTSAVEPSPNLSSCIVEVGDYFNDSRNSRFGLLGDFAELIIVSSTLATSLRQRFEGYLHWRWGLQANLPNDHPFKNAAPRAGTLVTIIRQHYAAQGAR